MIMRFRGGGVGHTSTRAATNIFKADRDIRDIMESHHREEEQGAPVTDLSNVEEQEDDENIVAEGSEDGIDGEGGLSESELADYGYEAEGESEEEEEEEEDEDEEDDGEGGEEDDTTIDELDALGYADY
jgi:hypothetical protein